ncbi:MAG: N-acetylneuraminate synthase family protein [Alphaproteobacteria bacterium]|nr:N-acetylneuraminate synthase family protein [Alphaproteobacteria bacterium]
MTTWLHNPKLGQPCTIIGEVAQSHDGSLGMAHAFIDALADCGADAVKFQTHIADAESTPGEPWRKIFSKQDKTRYEYWKRMEFTEEQWSGLRDHAHQRDLLFLSSPFSLEAADLLLRIGGLAGWKIASGELSNDLMLDAIVKTKLPIMMSTGMSTYDEIDTIIKKLKKSSAPLAVMQAASSYPCPPEYVGLNVIETFRQKYPDLAVGLSDHSASIFPGLAAATLGIEVLEVHITLSPFMFGPDVIASLTCDQFKQLVQGIRYIEKMKSNPVDKSTLPEDIQSLRSIFMKSIVVKQDLPAGTILEPHHLTLKKPGTGIPGNKINEFIGKRLVHNVIQNTFLKMEDIEKL